MSEQPRLFYENTSDVLRAVIQALGGAKKVGAVLKPDRTIDEAGRWVLDCLNPDRRERFDPDQVLWLLKEARRIGFHAAMHFVARECGYAAPAPLDPEDERQQLQRKVIEAAASLKQDIDRLERLAQAPAPNLQAVR